MKQTTRLTPLIPDQMKCALVTGGSRGIGKAICTKLAGMGYHILVNYKNSVAEADNTLMLITDNGGSGALLQFDVADKEEIKNVLGSWITTNSDKHIESAC